MPISGVVLQIWFEASVSQTFDLGPSLDLCYFCSSCLKITNFTSHSREKQELSCDISVATALN